MKYIIGFEDDEALDPKVVGRKFSSLARAARLQIPVPPAVAIHTAAHKHFIKHHCWPEGLSDQVAAAAKQLKLSEGISIRSSALNEDLEKRSFAGQYHTFLKIITEEELRKKIDACWQSIQSNSVQSYLQASEWRDDQHGHPLMAVILQKMVDAMVSGVAFGRDPMNPNKKRVVIEATEGLAEKLVSGHISPHRVYVDDNDGIKVFGPNGETGSHHALLAEDKWREIAALVRKVESHNGNIPQDIEWVSDSQKRLWLLQSRSITTLKKKHVDIPPGRWTRKIADDLWADRLTPFLADSMVRNAHRYDLTRVNKIVGIPTVVPTLTTINGYLYMNVAGVANLLGFIPKTFRVSDIRRILPPGYDMDRIPSPSMYRLLIFLLRSLLLIILEPGSNPLICFFLSRHHQGKILRRFKQTDAMPEDTPTQCLHKLGAAMKTMVVIQEKNQWPYFFANFFIMFLRWLVVDLMGKSHREFLDLLSHGGDNVTIRIEREFRRMAQQITRDPAFRSQFLNLPREEVVDRFPEPIRKEFNTFLSQYGSRSRHRTLMLKRWEEDPQEVIGILQSLVHFQSEANTDGRNKHAANNPGPPFSSIYRRLLSPILKMTIHYLDLREDLRFMLDKSLFQIRKAALAVGRQIGLEDKVFFLTLDELTQATEGGPMPQAVGDKATERYQKFQETIDPPAFYVNGMPLEELSDNEFVIKGVGTSPGIVSGCARIVDDPARADILKGDILVAANTDPGWTPILSIVGGMIMEEGGLLNHCSIVARELGVPSIVGVRHATKRIPEGSRVIVDGGLGLVRIDREPK